MPLKTDVVIPSEEPTGTTKLPFSRVKKIIAADQDIQIMSNAGAFIITLATEMFIQHVTQQAYNVVRSERKPRRNIQYRDLATAVSNHDNLEFLVDVVPVTSTYKQIKEKKAITTELNKVNGHKTIVNEIGQTTLDMPQKWGFGEHSAPLIEGNN